MANEGGEWIMHGGDPQGYEETRWPQMMGAIIGDIVGSVYEWNNIKTKKKV